MVFAMNESGLMKKINEILIRFPKQVIFSDDAGIRELQFRNKIDKITLLDKYYVIRGWNNDGIPSEEKLKELDLLEEGKTFL